MRTSNSVTVRIVCNDSHTDWQEIIVGGSVIFEWKVTSTTSSNIFNIRFSKKTPSDKVNYIVRYTHWEVMDKMSTAVINVRSDNFGVVYCPAFRFYRSNNVTVEISTDLLSPCTNIYDDHDFMLRGEDGSVPFHKVVLAAHSSVFKTMLAGDWKETSEGVINVPGNSKEMLQHLKMYMYLGKLPDKQNDQVECIKQLLLLSSYYLIEDLKLRCIKELRFLLTPENVTDMIQFAAENKIRRLFVEILDCAAMGDIDTNVVRSHIENQEANSESQGATQYST